MQNNKDYILSIDTTSKDCVVSLYNGKQHFTKKETQLVNKSNKALELVEKLLRESRVALTQCSHIAFVSGPGSFTGIRIGAVIVQALSMAHQIPVISISRLELMAMKAYNKGSAIKIIVCLEALREAVFFGEYVFNENTKMMIAKTPDCLYKKEELVKITGNLSEDFHVVTDISDITKNISPHLKNIMSSNELDSDVVTLSQIANSKKGIGDVLKAGNAMPQYLKGPHINVPKFSRGSNT